MVVRYKLSNDWKGDDLTAALLAKAVTTATLVNLPAAISIPMCKVDKRTG